MGTRKLWFAKACAAWEGGRNWSLWSDWHQTPRPAPSLNQVQTLLSLVSFLHSRAPKRPVQRRLFITRLISVTYWAWMCKCTTLSVLVTVLLMHGSLLIFQFGKPRYFKEFFGRKGAFAISLAQVQLWQIWGKRNTQFSYILISLFWGKKLRLKFRKNLRLILGCQFSYQWYGTGNADLIFQDTVLEPFL